MKLILALVLIALPVSLLAQEGSAPEGTPRDDRVVVPGLVVLQRTDMDPEYGYQPPDDAPDDIQLWCTDKSTGDPANWQGGSIILQDELGSEATRLDNVCVWFSEGNAYNERVDESYVWTEYEKIGLMRWWMKSWVVFDHVSRSKISQKWPNGWDISFLFEFDDATSGAFLETVLGGKYRRFCGTRAMQIDQFDERDGLNRDFSILGSSNSGRLIVRYRTRINWNC